MFAKEIRRKRVLKVLEYEKRRLVRTCLTPPDPVLASTSGAALLTPDGVAAMIEHLFPLCTLVTPRTTIWHGRPKNCAAMGPGRS